MANELKFGNKVIFLNGNPITLPIAAADPGSPSNGDMYYNSGTTRVRYYNGSIWQDLAYGTVITAHSGLTGLLNDDHTQYALLVGRSGGQTVIGGTASGDNLVLRSTSNATKGQVYIDETTAASSSSTGALRVAGGVGVGGSLYSGASLVAATSVLAPLIDAAAAGTLSIGTATATQLDIGTGAAMATLNLVTGSGNKTLNIGTGGGTNTINIGGSGSTVNINGTLQYVQTTQLQVSDPTLTLNKGGAAASANGAGFEIEENASITAYIEVANSRASWDMKAPASAGTVRISPSGNAVAGTLDFTALASSSKSFSFPNNSGTLALTSDLAGYLPLTGGSLTGDLALNAQHLLKLYDSTTTNYVAWSAPSSVTGAYTLKLPAAQGGNGQVLANDGSGNLSWVTNGSGTVNAATVANTLGVYRTAAASLFGSALFSSFNAYVAFASQTLSADRTYSIPDAGANADFVMTAGSQTIGGSKTFNNSILAGSNMALGLGSDANEWSTLWVGTISHNDSSTPNLSLSTTGNNGSIVLSANGTGNIDMVATKFRKSTDGTNFYEEQYFDSLSLAANTSSPTEISSSLSFAAASFDSAEVVYKIKEATSGKTRVGSFIVTTDGTVASSSDQFSETAALGSASGLSLDATITSGNVVIRYNNTHATNGATMRATIRRYRA